MKERHFPGACAPPYKLCPQGLRSRGIAVAYSGGSLGPIITPLLVTPIASRFGWRGAFWFTGFVGTRLVGRVGRLIARQHTDIAAAGIGAGKEPDVRLYDRRLWAFMSAYALGGAAAGIRDLRSRHISDESPWLNSGLALANCFGSHRSDGRSAISSGAGLSDRMRGEL